MAREPFPWVSHGERGPNILYLCPIRGQRHSLTSVTRSNSAFLLYVHYVFNMIQDGKGTFPLGFPRGEGDQYTAFVSYQGTEAFPDLCHPIELSVPPVCALCVQHDPGWQGNLSPGFPTVKGVPIYCICVLSGDRGIP